MSKKNRKQNQPAPPAPPDPGAEASAGAQPEVPPQETAALPRDASPKYFLIFWGLILLAATSAWILAALLPGVSESIIERWIMPSLAAALAVFLLIYR